MFQNLKAVFVISSLSLAACVSSFEGEYADPGEKEIIDDRWNETDARKTAEILINSMVKKPWIATFKGENKGQSPVVIIDDVENRTDEHIDIKALMESIRNELINSGQIRFVNASRRDAILKEIKYQQDSGMVSGATQKKKGKQTGADFFLNGAISSKVNKMGGDKSVVYQTNLILTNLETAEIVWSENFQVKKRFRRSGAGW
jgi:uncharacterized protein (TIGR02722 family)